MADEPIGDTRPLGSASLLGRLRSSFKGAANWMARIFGLAGMVPPSR